MSSVRIKIDKEYVFPSLETMSVRDFVDFSMAMKSESVTDARLVSMLIKCEESILEALPRNEFEKLLILTKGLLGSQISNIGIDISFLPLGSYPFGVFADLKKKIELYSGDERLIPWTIALLRPGVGYQNRVGYWLEWANELPASVGIYYHTKMMAEYVQLCETFGALKGDEPDENELKAGIEHLGRYGEYLSAFNLSNRDILKINEIMALPTNQVLTYLCVSKDVDTYTKELNTLRKRV